MTVLLRRHFAPSELPGAFVLAVLLGGSLGAVYASAPAAREPEACALLKTDEVSKALEVTSLAGKRLIAASPKVCVWSDDPEHGFNSRRVNLSIMSSAAFAAVKSRAGRIVIEPASGIGDEAYYELPKGESPFLFVRKGETAFSVRILNGLKLKAFTLEQERTKEADLAKAAASRL